MSDQDCCVACLGWMWGAIWGREHKIGPGMAEVPSGALVLRFAQLSVREGRCSVVSGKMRFQVRGGLPDSQDEAVVVGEDLVDGEQVAVQSVGGM